MTEKELEQLIYLLLDEKINDLYEDLYDNLDVSTLNQVGISVSSGVVLTIGNKKFKITIDEL